MSEATEVPAVEPTTESLQPAAVVEDQTTETPQSSESAPETQEQETKPPETEEQRKSKFQRRIERKNAELAAAKTEARLLRERLDAIEAKARPQQDSQAPKLEQFDNFEDYMAARVAYDAEKVVEARLTRAQQEEQQRRESEAQARSIEHWRDQQAKAAEKYPDFEEVVGDSDAPVTGAMSQAIVESEFGAEIAYHLAQHPDEAKAIAGMSPIRQIAAIGRLEAKLSQPPPKVVTQAPPPIVPVGAKAKAEKAPHEMTPKEFNEWRRRVIAQRR